MDLLNFDLDKIFQFIKNGLWTMVRIPFEYFKGLPMPIQILAKILLFILACLIAIAVIKRRHDWVNYHH